MAFAANTAPGPAPLEAFLAGQAVRAQDYLGAHPAELDGQPGYVFRVWAPRAKAVCVMGAFNRPAALTRGRRRLGGLCARPGAL